MKGMRAFVALGVFLFIFSSVNVFAVSQWSRKYGVSCKTCHTAFPRINYFAEQFKMNGFQMPGTYDGDDVAKHIIGDRLNLNELTDMFGLRIAVTPIEFETNGRTEGGVLKDEFDIGNPNWLQLFTAGTIFKNTTIFIETEIAGETIHNNWFYLGYHNILDTSLLNVRIGNLPMLDWHAISGRLRGIPNIGHRILSDVRASNGTGDDSVSMAGATPGIEIYGWQGPVVLSVGVANGRRVDDPNDDKNFFGTAKYYIAQEGDFAGSAVSVWGMFGTDTRDLVDELTGDPLGQAENEFWRLSPAFNIRYLERWDLQFGYFFGHDDDFDLTTAGDQETDFEGIAAILGYTINDAWWCAIQADWVNSDDAPGIEYLKISPSLWYFPRDNMRIGVVGRIDLESDDNEKHEAIFHVRSMF